MQQCPFPDVSATSKLEGIRSETCCNSLTRCEPSEPGRFASHRVEARCSPPPARVGYSESARADALDVLASYCRWQLDALRLLRGVRDAIVTDDGVQALSRTIGLLTTLAEAVSAAPGRTMKARSVRQGRDVFRPPGRPVGAPVDAASYAVPARAATFEIVNGELKIKTAEFAGDDGTAELRRRLAMADNEDGRVRRNEFCSLPDETAEAESSYTPTAATAAE